MRRRSLARVVKDIFIFTRVGRIKPGSKISVSRTQVYSFAVVATELIPVGLMEGREQAPRRQQRKKRRGGNHGDGFIPSQRRHHHRRYQECILPSDDSPSLRVLIPGFSRSLGSFFAFFTLIHLSTSSLRADDAFSFACPAIARSVLRRGSQRHNIGPLHRKKLRGLYGCYTVCVSENVADGSKTNNEGFHCLFETVSRISSASR